MTNSESQAILQHVQRAKARYERSRAELGDTIRAAAATGKVTHRQIGEVLGVSKQRVQQIVNRKESA
jgi:hypothetical protein